MVKLLLLLTGTARQSRGGLALRVVKEKSEIPDWGVQKFTFPDGGVRVSPKKATFPDGGSRDPGFLLIPGVPSPGLSPTSSSAY